MSTRMGRFLFRWRSYTPLPLILVIFLCVPPRDGGGFAPFLVAGGLGVSFLGIFIRVLAVGFAHSGTSGRESFLRADRLNTTGLYSMSRNPLYLANILMFNGLVIVYGNLFALLLCNLFLFGQYHLIIRSEESYLRDKYGEDYRVYCERVPRLLPRFSGFRSPGLEFHWRRVLVRENSSLLNWGIMLILILLLRGVRLTGVITHPWRYAGAVAGFVLLYLTIKALRKRWFE